MTESQSSSLRRRPELILRPVTWADSARLLRWRNDPETRRNSRNPEPVESDSHQDWLRRKLAAENCRLMIAEVAGRSIGTVRADFDSEAWWLSWSIDPNERGKGYGTAMVAAMVARLHGRVRATTKCGNLASERIAVAVGMARQEARDGFVYWEATLPDTTEGTSL